MCSLCNLTYHSDLCTITCYYYYYILYIIYIYITGIGVRGAYHVPIRPNKPLAPGDNTYEFEIPTFQGSMLHLKEALLQVGGRLKRLRTVDGTYGALAATPKEGEKITLANNVLHTLFKDVTVHIGHNQVMFERCCLS